jgi:EmrB/QacA subfamily drug resistance transporter
MADPIPQRFPAASPDRRRWWALTGASLAIFMAALDTNVVNVALPAMAQSFHVTREIRWVSLAYIVPTTALLGVFGAVSDMVGRRLITLVGVVVFVAGSALCGAAANIGQLIAFRVVQGIGGSCVGSAIIAIATVGFAPHERGRAMSVVALVAPLGAVVGPSVGGFLIGALGWPAIFYINVPVGVVAFALIARFLRRGERSGARAFDGAGAVLFTLAVVLLLGGLSPTAGGLSTGAVVALAACAASLVAFVLVERRAANPLVPMPLIRRPSFSVPVIGILTAGVLVTGLGFVMPFFLESTLRLGPAMTGLTMLFAPLGVALLSQVGGRLTDRFHPAIPAAIGAAVSIVGVLLLLPLDSRWGFADVAIRLVVVGIGMGLFLSPSNVAAMAATPREHVGVGGALVNTARYLGFALGPTLATALWSPGLQGQAGIAGMRTVLAVLAGAQVVTLLSVIAYRVDRSSRARREPAGQEEAEPSPAATDFIGG